MTMLLQVCIVRATVAQILVFVVFLNSAVLAVVQTVVGFVSYRIS